MQRILLIESDEANRLAYCIDLMEAGYDVIATDAYRTAEILLNEDASAFDLVVTQVGTRKEAGNAFHRAVIGHDGVELARRYSSRIPVIVLHIEPPDQHDQATIEPEIVKAGGIPYDQWEQDADGSRLAKAVQMALGPAPSVAAAPESPQPT
jgi:hypothetical protein